MRIHAGKDLVALKAAAKTRIDMRAGDIRSLFFVSSPGQESEYQIKTTEAKAYLALPNPETLTEAAINARFPLLATDADVDGNDLATQAASILTQVGVWSQVLAIVNRMRRSKKRLIDAATTVTAIEALVESMNATELFKTAPELAELVE